MGRGRAGRVVCGDTPPGAGSKRWDRDRERGRVIKGRFCSHRRAEICDKIGKLSVGEMEISEAKANLSFCLKGEENICASECCARYFSG